MAIVDKLQKNRRRNYFIKTKFQRNFIIKFCILAIISSLVTGTAIYLVSKSTVITTFENSRLQIKSTADFILPTVLVTTAMVIPLIGLAAVAVTLFTSHRIAGPLYRMEKDIQEISLGNLKKRFNLRWSDEIRPLADDLDQMTQFLRAGVADIKARVLELESALQASGGPSGEVKSKLQDLKTALAKFDT